MPSHSGLATVKATPTVASTDRRKTVATVAELKAQADSLGVKYTSKILKADLEELIAAASRPARMSNAARRANYVRQNDTVQGYGRLTPRQARRLRKAENRSKCRA